MSSTTFVKAKLPIKNKERHLKLEALYKDANRNNPAMRGGMGLFSYFRAIKKPWQIISHSTLQDISNFFCLKVNMTVDEKWEQFQPRKPWKWSYLKRIITDTQRFYSELIDILGVDKSFNPVQNGTLLYDNIVATISEKEHSDEEQEEESPPPTSPKKKKSRKELQSTKIKTKSMDAIVDRKRKSVQIADSSFEDNDPGTTSESQTQSFSDYEDKALLDEIIPQKRPSNTDISPAKKIATLRPLLPAVKPKGTCGPFHILQQRQKVHPLHTGLPVDPQLKDYRLYGQSPATEMPPLNQIQKYPQQMAINQHQQFYPPSQHSNPYHQNIQYQQYIQQPIQNSLPSSQNHPNSPSVSSIKHTHSSFPNYQQPPILTPPTSQHQSPAMRGTGNNIKDKIHLSPSPALIPEQQNEENSISIKVEEEVPVELTGDKTPLRQPNGQISFSEFLSLLVDKFDYEASEVSDFLSKFLRHYYQLKDQPLLQDKIMILVNVLSPVFEMSQTPSDVVLCMEKIVDLCQKLVREA